MADLSELAQTIVIRSRLNVCPFCYIGTVSTGESAHVLIKSKSSHAVHAVQNIIQFESLVEKLRNDWFGQPKNG